MRSITGLAVVAHKPPFWEVQPEAIISVRPEKIRMSLEYPNQPYNVYRGILNNVLYRGDHSQFIVDLNTSENVPPIRVRLVRSNHQGDRIPPLGSQVYVSWIPEDSIALPKVVTE